MIGAVRRALAGVVAVIVLAGCGADAHVLRPAVVAPPTVASPGGPEHCVEGVAITLGEVDGARGLRAAGITVRNCSRELYTLQGYPAR